MADNSTLPVSVGTEVFANDDISSVKYPRVKLTWGPDGTANDTDVASGKSVPAQIRTSGGTAQTYGAGATDAGTQRVTIASEQVEGGEYEAVPSTSSTTTTLGTTGAVGDFLSTLLVTPLTTSPGSISIKDGSDTAILVFAGGATSVSNLVPFSINVGAASRTGAWQVVTGSGGNVQALGVGNFT